MALSSGRGAAALPLRVHRLRPGLLVAVTLLLGLEAAVGGSTGTRLDEGNFRQLVGDENVWVVEVGSSRCGTCQEFAPVWGKVASQVGSRAKFGFVDIDEKGGMALAKELNALEDGVPQVRIFRRLRDE